LPSGFPKYLLTHVQGFISRFRPPNPFAHTRDGFNEYGDYVGHLALENQPFPSKDRLVIINRRSLNYFYEFVDDFTQRGITVLLSYPSFEEQSFRNSAAFIQELDGIFGTKENLQVISKPESFCYPTDTFYDSVYHLNAEGRAMRTARLIEDLEASGLFGTAYSDIESVLPFP
jgi:hypothetical protein